MKRRNVLKLAAAASTSAGTGLLVLGAENPEQSRTAADSVAAAVGPGSADLMPGMRGMAGAAGETATAATAATLTPFVDAMPRLADAVPTYQSSTTDYYSIDIKASTAQLAPGPRSAITSYGGGFVGPTIHATRGRKVAITYNNTLDAGVVVHLHGGHVPASSDGFPTDELAAGTSRVYTYPNNMAGATLWYHDHRHMMEAENVYKGLHGVYILHDPAEDRLNLPGGRYDVPIMLTDAFLDDANNLVYDPTQLWSVALANGKARPYFAVGRRRYRFRIVNGSNHRAWSLSLSDGTPITQVAGDGGLLPAPSAAPTLDLSAAERGEIIVDFSPYSMGTHLYLQDAALGQIIRFDVTETSDAETGPTTLPSSLLTLPALGPAANTRRITLSLSADDDFLINGRTFDPDYIEASIPVGTTEIWEIVNVSGFEHNFHIHLVQFRVLTVNGDPPGPAMSGLKDTVPIPVAGTVRLQATFSDYKGKFAFHCHLLEHASLAGMMATMQIT